MKTLIFETRYTTIESFIEALKKKNDVVGILEYGGRTYKDMESGGDYDLTVILDAPLSDKITGLHFHILDIPVDCMILTLSDFDCDYPDNPFLLVHLDCKILYDRNGSINTLLEKIKGKWQSVDVLSEFETMLFRFSFKHILDKLEHRLFDNPVYSKYFIYASVDWMLECYARMHHLQIGKAKAHLAHIQHENPKLYNDLFSKKRTLLSYGIKGLQTFKKIFNLCCTLY